MPFIKPMADPYEPGRTLDQSYWQPNVVSINQRAQTVQIEFDGYASEAAYLANPAKTLDTKTYTRNVMPYLAAIAGGQMNPLDLPYQVALDSDNFFADATRA